MTVTLRAGSAEEAGLLPEPLARLAAEAEAGLGPSPVHPRYAGAVLLAGRGGTVALHHAVGYAVRYRGWDEEAAAAVELPPEQWVRTTKDTVHDLASVSKVFTAVLAVQQLERGALDLDAEVAAYLPEFGAAGKEHIRVGQLLTHTSGLRPELPFYDCPTAGDRRRLLWDEAPVAAPGTAYVYSDLNLITLQWLLERVTGRGLEALLRDEITAPLGMRHTRFNPPAGWRPGIAATEDVRKPWAKLDRGPVRGEVHDENAYAFGGVSGHAGVFSDAWDLAVLARTLLNGGSYGAARILSRASAELLFTDFNTALPGYAHSLGLDLDRPSYMGGLSGPRTAGHGGFTGTGLLMDPDTDTFLVVLSNAVHPVRTWRGGAAARLAAANWLARAVPGRAGHRPGAGHG